MGLRGEVEALICCLDPGSVGVVVAAASILGARKSAVGEGPGESGSDAALDSGKAVACENLEVLVGLKVLDNMLSLGVGDDELEADKVVVLTSVCGTDGGEKVITLGFIRLAMAVDFGFVRILQGIKLILARASVWVRHANIKNKRALGKRQSYKDIALVIAVSMLGHGRLAIGALDVCGARGGYKLFLDVVVGSCHTAAPAHHFCNQVITVKTVSGSRISFSPLRLTARHFADEGLNTTSGQ